MYCILKPCELYLKNVKCTWFCMCEVKRIVVTVDLNVVMVSVRARAYVHRARTALFLFKLST